MQRISQDIGISHNIRKIRKRKKMRQIDVVGKMHLLGCEISRTTYVKIEKETHGLRISDLVALKTIFYVEYSEFFAGLELFEISEEDSVDTH